MKVNWTAILSGAIIVIVAAAVIWSAGPKKAPDEARIFTSINDCTAEEQEKYAKMADNMSLFSEEISQYTNVVKQYPASYSALSTTIYASVRPADVINPFTGDPVQDNTAPSAGNTTWTYASPTLTITFYYVCNGVLQSEAQTWSSDELSGFQPSDWSVPSNLTQSEQYAHEVCNFLKGYVDLYYVEQGALPADYSALASAYPVVTKARNEFNGGHAQHVPDTSPSAGDFTFTLKTDPQGRPYTDIRCYGQDDWIVVMHNSF